jgi:hypothetical protein
LRLISTSAVEAPAGEGIDGPLDGRRLEPAIALDSFWFTWAAFHPETAIFRAA